MYRFQAGPRLRGVEGVSHAVEHLTECYEQRLLRAIRLLAARHGLCCFQLTFAEPAAAGPRAVTRTGSSSRRLTLHSRVASACHRPRDRSHEDAPSQGLSPLRDVDVWSPLAPRFLGLDYVPPAAFLTLSTVSSSRHPVGLFRPTATCRIRTSGVFPAPKPYRAHRPTVPSCRFGGVPREKQASRCQRAIVAFRALIQGAIRCR